MHQFIIHFKKHVQAIKSNNTHKHQVNNHNFNLQYTNITLNPFSENQERAP
jgi:hypothetical protein